MKRPIFEKICIGCRKKYKFCAFRTEISKRKYCTRKCANKYTAAGQSITKRGAGNPMFGKRPSNFLGRKLNYHGYWEVFAPYHPFARKKFVLEHRLIMEKKIGRYLKPKEVVHHIDGNTKNNNINNLKLFKNDKEHRKYHRA